MPDATILPLPVGTGETRRSPDGKFEATVYDWFDEGFWGARRSWYAYDVREVGSGRVIERFTSDRLESPYFGSRSGHRVVMWAPDSATVRFAFSHVDIVVKVSPR